VADTGASLRDLMARMGHDSARGNVNAYDKITVKGLPGAQRRDASAGPRPLIPVPSPLWT
jgi:hypothetical protein